MKRVLPISDTEAPRLGPELPRFRLITQVGGLWAHRLGAIAIISLMILAITLPWWNRIWSVVVTHVVVACDHVTTVFTTGASSAREGGSGNKSSANWYVSPTGSDSNPCTQASPCATPDHAFNLASPGETVQVAAGTYDYGSSAAVFTKSGTAGNYITVTCATRGACRIQNSLTGNTTVVGLKGSYISFDGFEVTNTSSAGNNIGLYVTGSFVNITRNTVHHIETDCTDMGGGGIVVAGSGSANYQLSNITIDSNLVYDISMPNGVPRCNSSVVQTHGILDENNANYNVVTNNIVYWVSGGWGMAMGNGCCTGGTVVGNQVSNNLVFSTSRGGILAGASAGVYLTNNIILVTGLTFDQCAYMLAPTPSITYANSDLFNNRGGNYCANWGTTNSSIHAGDIAVDPASGTTFVKWQANGSGDYHEKAGSPTIGTGSTAGTPPNHDFDGNPRPATGIDMGPYQYHQ